MGSAATRRRGRSRVRLFVTALQILILLGISASLGAGIAMFISLSTVIPQISNVEAPEATIIYSSERVVLARIFHENRTNRPLDDIPKDLREATVAIEDTRFYQHSGVDMKGIARAIWANVRGHRLSQGGSTITQQLARNVYLTRRKTVQRKIQEAVLAILLERHLSKDRILELYLNRVYYGSGAFGVQAASRVYFGKNVEQLNLAECALLAGLTQKPSGYSPHEDRQAAIRRRNHVLNRMFSLGIISEQQCESAKREDPAIVPRTSGRQTYKARHFVDYVVKRLKDRYGDDVLYSGGLRVYTTLNYQMQEIAEKALREGVHRYERSRRVTEGCFVAVEAGTGYIRAMVGSVDPNSEFNRCTQGLGQQPGSSFKAFVYTAAFAEGGMRPNDRVSNERITYAGSGGKVWRPRNYDGRYGGRPTIKRAIEQSINLPAIAVAKRVGIEKVIEYAHLMGVKSELQPYLSTAIGASEVYPLEMASAYATFANNGAYVEPTAVVRVTNARDEVIEDFQPQATPVISERVNEMMDDCLRGVVTRGTGTSAGIVRDARGKTGTTNDDRDAWWIGYVPHKMAAACWVGNDNNAPMRGAYGGKVCAPIWAEFMNKAMPILDKILASREKGFVPKKEARPERKREPETANLDEKPETTREPDQPDVTQTEDADVTDYAICDETGLLATDNCPSHVQSFREGDQPRSYCTSHRRAAATGARVETRSEQPAADTTMVTVPICPESGMLAGPGCPNRTRKKVPIDKVPTQVCNQHPPR